MASSDNILDVVEELRQIVADLKRTLYGDQATHSAGILTEFDSLRKDVLTLQQDVQALKTRRPNVGAWVLGYFSFCAGVALGVIAFLNSVDSHNVFGMPAGIALWLAALFAVGALFMFMWGFGWFDGRA